MADNEIDVLKAEIARLRSALSAIGITLEVAVEQFRSSDADLALLYWAITEKAKHIARTALEKP